MNYDILAESVKLIEGASLPDVARLSRRVRWMPLGVDRVGDVAVTLFLHRGVNGVPMLRRHVLVRSESGWRYVGGGGGGPADHVVGDRPSMLQLEAAAMCHGVGGTRVRGHGWVSNAELRCAVEVATLRVGRRIVPVAGNGNAVILWTSRRTPKVQARDATGAVLGSVDLRSVGRRMPRRIRGRRWWPGRWKAVPAVSPLTNERRAHATVTFRRQ